MKEKIMKKSIVATLVAAALLATGASAIAADAKQPTKTVVLVHGAFADGSSWNKVVPLLQAEGLKVVAVQNPLTSLKDDVAFAHRAIDSASGPVVLVGHSWGGSVITQAGDHEKVKALVYVAAFAPNVGETSVDAVQAYPQPVGLKSPQVDSHGYLTLSGETIASYFAQDVSPAEANLITVSQGAINGASFAEKLTSAAWQTKPSYYVVAEKDYMIQPDAQRAAAKRINAKVTSLATSHVPMLSKPREVARVIIEAANSIK
jgi:pimeloyl-ACP methyl ester carboxylesterase